MAEFQVRNCKRGSAKFSGSWLARAAEKITHFLPEIRTRRLTTGGHRLPSSVLFRFNKFLAHWLSPLPVIRRVRSGVASISLKSFCTCSAPPRTHASVAAYLCLLLKVPDGNTNTVRMRSSKKKERFTCDCQLRARRLRVLKRHE